MVIWQLGQCVHRGAHLPLYPLGMRGMPVSWREKGHAVPGQGCGGGGVDKLWVISDQIIRA